MPRISDYHVVSDTAVKLSKQSGAPDDRTYTFQLNKDFSRSSSLVLVWRSHAQNARNLKYQVTVGNTNVWQVPGSLFDGEALMTLHEAVSGSAFRPGNQEQTITFQVTGGQGTVHISDIVLYFQRDI